MQEMKTIAVLVLGLTLGCVVALADTQVRFGINAATLLHARPTRDAVRDSFADRSRLLHGLHWEIIHDRLGFGGHALVRFDRQPATTETYLWSLDWDGDLFMSAHLNGVGRFLDPFVELGLGSAGRVYLDDREDGLWVQDEHGLWHYVTGGSQEPSGVQSMSLYPYLAAGLALDFRGLLVGTRVCYRPWNEPVPATQFATYDLAPFQVTVFWGVALGGHRRGCR